MGRNERKTEDYVDGCLRRHGYYASRSKTVVEKQKSDVPRIQKLLENASKSGGGVGRPEYIISSSEIPGLLIVIECKADPKKHVSSTLDHYADYAVDGVLLYASFLSKEFDVLAIAVSGESKANIRVSHYFQLRGDAKAFEFIGGSRELAPLTDYYEALINTDAKFRQDYNALLEYSRKLNNLLQAKKMPEAQRGFLISAILIALQNKAFRDSYRLHRSGKQLAASLLGSIDGEFEHASLTAERRANLRHAFAFIQGSPTLISDHQFFIHLIDGIDSNVNSFMRTHKYYDTIGQFYVEFLRYANNDKGLGIVLTPRHVAELFSELAEVDKNSVVFDNCCGTAGLLIAAMDAMIRDAGADKAQQSRIKKHQLFGIEFQPLIYALAVSNMILHGDGKTNILCGDCFSGVSEIRAAKPNVGLLNPPYKNKTVKDDKEELEFVANNLEYLQPGGKCVAIVPVTCATAPSGVIADWKRTLLEQHTLEAVMSMPIELFHNSKTTVVTCVMVFTAHRPHPKGKKTWFGYWRDDGHIKTKHKGRLDAHGRWSQIKAHWITAYRNREVIEGFSVAKEVGPSDEWLAEAYLETDYAAIGEHALFESAKQYLLTTAMMIHDVRVTR